MNDTHKYIDIVKKIILDNINCNDYSVFMFGSRALGKISRTADIGIGIIGEKLIGKLYHK